MKLFKWLRPDPQKRQTALSKITRDGEIVGTVLSEERPSNYKSFQDLVVISLSCGGPWPDHARMDRFEAFDAALSNLVYTDGRGVNPLVVYG